MGTKPKHRTKPIDTATGQTQAKAFPVAGSDKFGDARREAPNFDDSAANNSSALEKYCLSFDRV
ncbi:MAG: hypothetical protein MUF71_14250 [Candidatus Kapabacteria bacterium]|jgi:hypothetical protein|nr:hypothetical protein [Candidatus Kapabacteria bacterium]